MLNEVVDVTAFDRWYRVEHPKVLAALAIVARDEGAALEAVDEAFARSYARWSQVRTMSGPAAWTCRTALRVLRRRRRRAAMAARLHLRRAVRDRSGRPPSDWSPEVWEALGGLPAHERTAIALRYAADLPVEDIAITTAVAPAMVSASLDAARWHLAEALGDEHAAAALLIDLDEVPDV